MSRARSDGYGLPGKRGREGIGGRARVALLAFQPPPQHARASLPGQHPGAHGPGRIVAHVLEMPAGQFRDPVVVLVEVKTGDGLLHVLVDPEIPGRYPPGTILS